MSYERVIESDAGVLFARVIWRGDRPRCGSGALDRLHALTSLACVRREGARAVVAQPFAPAHAELLSEEARSFAGALVAGACPCTEAGKALLDELVRAGMAEPCEGGLPGAWVPGRDGDRAWWSFGDAWCHEQRLGDVHRGPWGGTYPHADQVPPLPRYRQSWSEEDRVVLESPDVETQGMPYLGSSREFAPLEKSSLGRFLGRLMGERGIAELRTTGPVQRSYEFLRRSYPSGGACHELELYLAVECCQGVSRGMWHYDAQKHCLVRVRSASTEDVELFVDGSASALGDQSSRPPVVVLVAARFARVYFKYEAMGYGLVLQHVGVLLRTAHWIADREGLALCGNGVLLGERFARATRLEWCTEGLVGAFALGARSTGRGDDD